MPNESRSSNCLTQDLLIGLLQDSLPKNEQLRAAEHVQTCTICQKELETICEQGKLELPRSTSFQNEPGRGSVAEWSGKLAERLLAELQQDGPSVPTSQPADPPSMATIISTEEESPATEQTAKRGAVDSETSVTQQHSSRSDSPTELHIAEMFGRYEVEKILGQGAMGAVYLARDTQLDRDVALKIPKFGSGNNVDDQELLERFYREARAAATLRSPYICPVYDVGEINGQHYITMAYIEGRPLKDFTKSKKKHSEKQIATTVRKLAQGLYEAHTIGVVHRDLKPANVMVDMKGEPVVMDFGLARRSSSDDVQVTQSGAIMGTPAYMSPEQVEGDQEKIGPQADIYALGIIMYELITGDMPYKGSLMSILQQIALNNPEKPSKLRPDLDPRMERICLKMMAGDLSKRYQTMEEVAADLQDVLRTPRKKTKQVAPQREPKPTSIPTATEESNPALLSIKPQSITEQLREKRSGAASKSKRKSSSHTSSSGVNKNLLIAGGVIGLLLLMMGIVFLVRVAKYDVQITLDDPSITLSVDGETLNINKGSDVIKLSAGEHQLQLEKDGLKTHVEEFTVTKDGKTALIAKVVNGQLDALLNAEQPAGNRQLDKEITTTAIAGTGSTTAPSGNYGLRFDGDPSQTVVADLTGEEPIDAFTLEGWITLDHSRQDPTILEMKGMAKEATAKLQFHHINGWMAYRHHAGASMGRIPIVFATPRSHVATVYSPGQVSLFVNGKLLSSTPMWRSAPCQFDRLSIGTTAIEGTVDEVRLSRVARYTEDFVPAEELESDDKTIALYHFEEGSGDVLKDSSGNGYDGKIVGAKWVRAENDLVAYSRSTDLGQTGGLRLTPGDGVVIDSLKDETDSLTMEFWLQVDKSDSHIYLLGPSRDYCLRTGSTGQIALKGVKSSVPNRYELGDPARFPTARFVHVAMVRDAETQQHRLYVDGTLSESVDKIVSPLRDHFQIGGTERQYNFQAGLGFDGLIDEIRISSSARYSGQSFSPQLRFDPDENTLALYHCDEIKDGLLLDSSGNNHHGKVFGATIQSIKFDVPTGVKIGPAPSVSSSEMPPPAVAPFDTKQAKAHQEAWADYLGVPVEYENSIGMKFRLIPPGEFLMGSTSEEIEAAIEKIVLPGERRWEQCFKSEGPRHKVILTHPIYVGSTEVTQSQYEQVMLTNPSHFSATGEGKDLVIGLDTSNYPVETVSWNDAAEFCAKLSQQENLKPYYVRSGETVMPLDGTGYRLPTEAEWEFACRAGTTTRFWSGDGDQDLSKTAWTGKNSRGRSHEVGTLKANSFDLSDMHGNVWEWVQDSWQPDFYGTFEENEAVDPSSPFPASSERVIRGGNWFYPESRCRSSLRFADFRPLPSNNGIGFRVALPVDAVKESLQPKDASSTSKVTKGWPADAPPAAVAPFDASQAKVHQQAWADYLGEPVETTNSIGMQLAVIPQGSFKMGESGETVDVTLTKPFRLGIHVVTQGQWQAVMATEPWKGQVNVIEGDKIPATYVSWTDATEFCHQLTERERAAGKLRDGWEYCLPTEAEWEWACRAGTTTRYSFGDDESLLEEHAWFNSNTKNAGEAYAHQVGLKKPNPWGLYDIHGNVWEWCSDWSGDALPGGTDPSGPTEGSHRVHRGGSCDNSVRGCRSALRLGGAPSGRHDRLGFRVALSPTRNSPLQPVDLSDVNAH